jgi:hypothetical protein
MVTLDTLRALHEHDHQYVFVGRKPRCSYCRGVGTWQLRPPVMRPGIGGRRLD